MKQWTIILSTAEETREATWYVLLKLSLYKFRSSPDISNDTFSISRSSHPTPRPLCYLKKGWLRQLADRRDIRRSQKKLQPQLLLACSSLKFLNENSILRSFIYLERSLQRNRVRGANESSRDSTDLSKCSTIAVIWNGDKFVTNWQGKIPNPKIQKILKHCQYVEYFLLITRQFLFAAQIHSKGVKSTHENSTIFRFCVITCEM